MFTLPLKNHRSTRQVDSDSIPRLAAPKLVLVRWRFDGCLAREVTSRI